MFDCTFKNSVFLFSMSLMFSWRDEMLPKVTNNTVKGHITTGIFKQRGNQYIQLVKVLYCKLLPIGKQLPAFLHKVRGLKHRPQRWEASLLPLCHCGPRVVSRCKYGWYNTLLRLGRHIGFPDISYILSENNTVKVQINEKQKKKLF